MIEVIKSIIFVILGLILGIAVCSGAELWLVICTVVVVIVALIVADIFIIMKQKNKRKTVSYGVMSSSSSVRQDARISRTPQNSQVKEAQEVRNQESKPQVESSVPAAKTQKNENRKQMVKMVALINEEGTTLLEWSVQGKTSMIIGKSTPKEPVDIDLSGSAVAQMISKQHAVLNYTEEGWFIDDIDSKNGTRVRKVSQNSIMDVKLVGSVQVEVGDIIYIANTMLQIK